LRHSNEVRRARELGIPVVSQMQLFLDLCQAPVCGISGSSGKSTTTALVDAMATEAGIAHTVGGNIGVPLLARVGSLDPAQWVVLEISHTQLQYTTRSPRVATLTNVTPNHLDQFSWDEYVALKRNLLAHQRAGDVAILNADDPVGRGFAAGLKSAVHWSGRCDAPRADGAFLVGDAVVVRSEGREAGKFARDAIGLRGEHNVANVLAACATAAVIGIPVSAIEATARTFAGVPHRLQAVGRANGATWIDDSIATSPERTIAGIRAFDEPVVLLLGGREKNLPLEGLADEISARARGIVCFGEAGPLFYERLAGHAARAALVRGLDEAVEAAASIVQDGDVVLLSPAGTSFDAYPNFEARGDAFAQLVQELPGFEAEATD
jgi:UDP-N-acetylmuramoylalanine--D-glutamate ligase